MARRWTNAEFAEQMASKKRALEKLRYELISGYGQTKNNTYSGQYSKPNRKFGKKQK